MKILLLNWQDPENPQAGGAETHLKEIFGRMAERGHRVDWLVSGWKGAPTRAAIDGMQIYRTGSRYTFGLTAPGTYRRHFREQDYDIVVEALNKVPLYSPVWAKPPVALLVHHLFGSTAFEQAAFPLAAATWLQERPLSRIYRGCALQAISESTAEDLGRRGLSASTVRVIHPGVDTAFFCPSDSPTRAIPPTFLYIGRLERYKRVDLILDAFASLLQRTPVARLVIAGRGDQDAPLQKRASELGISERVHFAGFVTEEQKRNLMRTAWANVFLSPKEGWGMTNLEAAACGTPTIASHSPGLRESVINGETGILVRHGNKDALESALARVAGNPDLVETLGQNARQNALRHTWETAVDATERHLEAVVAGGAPGTNAVNGPSPAIPADS